MLPSTSSVMISKELLGNILNIDVAHISKSEHTDTISVHERCFMYPLTYDASSYLTINIHELAHKCKLWIVDNGYGLSMNYVVDSNTKEFSHFECLLYGNPYVSDYFDMGSEDESQAIFKACEWVLNNKVKK